MKKEKLIEEVQDNMDKQQTYRNLMGKYKKAMNSGFYFEALLISYAMIEDRLRSFLYYIGAFRERNAIRLNVTKTKKQLRILYFGSEEMANGKKMNIDQISVKEELIRKTIHWTMEYVGEPDDAYLRVLKKTYIGFLDLDGMITILDEIDTWREYRNEVIHGLLNKNWINVNQDIRNEVELGMKAARFLDNQIKILKRNNCIRKKMKIKD